MEYIVITYGDSAEEVQEYLSHNSYYFRSSKPKFITKIQEGMYAFRVDLVGSSLNDVSIIAVEPKGKNEVDIRRWM